MKRKDIMLVGGICLFFFMAILVSSWDGQLNTGLVGYWSFNETGGVINDTMGINHGIGNFSSNSTDARGVAGILNNSIEFTPSDYINISTTNALYNMSNFSISVWINPKNLTSESYILDHRPWGQGDAARPFSIYAIAETVRFGVTRQSDGLEKVVQTSDFYNGTWQHIVVKYDSGTGNLSLWRNGTIEDSDILSGGGTLKNQGDAGWYIGIKGLDLSKGFNGSIDELGIWNRSLSKTEIEDLYNSGSGLSFLPAPPSVTLNNPTNFRNYTYDYFAPKKQFVEVNCSATSGDSNVVNVTHWINGESNFTQTGSASLLEAYNNLSFEPGQWNWTCSASDVESQFSWASNNWTFTIDNASYFIYENNRTFTEKTYETATEEYILNVTANASLTAVNLVYDGDEFAATNSGQLWSRNLTLGESDVGNNSIRWKLTYGGDTIYSPHSYQDVQKINFSYCPSGTEYINFTFQDEGNFSAVGVTIPDSSFEYWLGNGAEKKNYTYTSSTAKNDYAFCFNITTLNVTTDARIQYTATGYPQRVYDPSAMTLNNSGHNVTLYLLATADGLYVTFQVINLAEQTISNVDVTATRVISGVETTVGEGSTGDDGTVTFWLNPDFVHTLTFESDDYEDYTTSLSPTQSSYTIQLGEAATADTDYVKGVSVSIAPALDVLVNDTSYLFQENVTSSFWTIEEFGFVLMNSSDDILSTNSSSADGGSVSNTLSVGNNTQIKMQYYYVINSTYQNYTRTWVVYDESGDDWSIKNFFSDLVTYISTGMFGIDNFGIALLTFVFIFVFTGMMSYSFGLRSPAAIMALIFSLVLFFDVGLGNTGLTIIPNVAGIHFVTVLTGLIMLGILVREGIR